MRIPRIFEHSELVVGTELVLSKQASHHLLNVLRRKVGDQVELFNNQYCVNASISNLDKLVTVTILSENNREHESELSLELAFSLIKLDRVNTIIQKATELGIKKIHPLITERTVVSLAPERVLKKMDNWHGVATHAAAQCYRNIIPSISKPTTLTEFLQQPHSLAQKIYLHPTANDSLTTTWLQPVSTIVLIGPEGGFTEQELVFLQEYQWHAASLGNRILRAETAVIATVAILQNLLGDM